MSVIKLAGVGLIVLVLLGVFVLAYLGFVPVLSDLMGTNKQKELGVTFSEINYAQGLAKVPGATVLNPEYLCITCNYASSGSIPVNTFFTQEEFTAMVNKRNSTVGPLRNAQLKFNADGTVEASGLLVDSAINGPIYAKGRIDSVNGRSATLKLDSVTVGNVTLAGEQAKAAEQLANDMIRDTFAKNPGLSITSISIEEGKVNFSGTLPKDVSGNPDAGLVDYTN
jgi:hypothetical protein